MYKSVVKVSVTENQTRITIPKPLALHCQLINEDGKPGKYTHVIVREDVGRTLHVSPINMEVPPPIQ